MKKLAVITTHPIQYYAPFFKLLNQRKKIDLKVFYTSGSELSGQFDRGFNKIVKWDVELLDDYKFQWIKNLAKEPGSHHFFGVRNVDLIEEINNYKPDSLLVIGWAYYSHIQILRHFKNKIPIFFRGDSTLLDDKRGIKNFLKSFFLKWVYSHVAYAFYTGTNNMAYFKKYGLLDEQLIFGPHAVDNERFSENRPADAREFRKMLGVKEDDILILFAGKFENKKSPLLLLKAFLSLQRKDCHLVFVGSGLLETELKDHATNVDNVHFVNFQNQSYMPAVYQSCDLFCLPSKGPGETWGLAINEAMACKKAILASDKVGCAVDLIKPGINGEIFISGNIQSLFEKLTSLLSSKESLKNMGRSSGERIQHWNYKKFAIQIENKVLS